MLKVVHLADTQIRNFQRHAEFRQSYEHLYESLRKKQPDIIVFTGDLAHTKTNISPEFVQLCANYLKNLADIAPLHIIPGNHDLALSNRARLDALTPVIEALDHENIHYYKDSGVYAVDTVGENLKCNLVVYSFLDKEEDWPVSVPQDAVNIGLYHGFVVGAQLQNGMIAEDGVPLAGFLDIVDYLLLGDIHRMQILDGSYRAAYCGSYPQQNYGEKASKGYLFWEIESKTKHELDFVELPNICPYYTLKLEEKNIPDVPDDLRFQKKARIRVLSRQLNISEKDSIKNRVSDLYDPVELKFLDDMNPHRQEVKISTIDTKVENLVNVGVQEKLIRHFLEKYELSNEVFEKMFDINRRLNAYVRKEDDILRNVQYRFGKMSWSNTMSYGEGNEFDFSKHKGLVGVFGKNATGKALDIDTEIPTVDGWKTVETIIVGDFVFGLDGNPTQVIAKSPVYRNRVCYEVVFSDGQKVICDAEHLWTVQDHFARAKKQNIYQTLSTRNLKKLIKWRKKDDVAKAHIGNEWSVDVCDSVKYLKKILSIHPYVLGCWLGDGTSSSSGFTCADLEIIDNLINFGEEVVKHNCKNTDTAYLIKGLSPKLRDLGILNNKHIPRHFLQSSVEDREYLLAGLLDTDGHCSDRDGRIEFCNTNKLLAEQVCELACSLGYKATLLVGDATLYGRFISKKYRVCFSTYKRPFLLERKNKNIVENRTKRISRRFIVSVEKVKRRSVQCLVVDNSLHLFLITKRFIPTHNSSMVVDIPLYCKDNKISKKVVKNDLIINENKDSCSAGLEIFIGDDTFKIDRKTSVYLKSGKRKGEPVYQGKTEVDFQMIKGSGEVISKNGIDPRETNKNIRKIFGTAEDFMATSVAPQWQLLNFINLGGTERQNLIGRYFDVDIFTKKHAIAKKEIKDIVASIRLFEKRDFGSEIREKSSELETLKAGVEEGNAQKGQQEQERDDLQKKIEQLQSMIINVSLDSSLTEKGILKDIERAKVKAIDKKKEIEKLGKQIEYDEGLVNDLEKSLTVCDVTALRKKQKDLEDVYEKIYECRQRCQSLEERIVVATARIKEMGKYECLTNSNCCMLKEVRQREDNKTNYQLELKATEEKMQLLEATCAELGDPKDVCKAIKACEQNEEVLEKMGYSIGLRKSRLHTEEELFEEFVKNVKDLEDVKKRYLENKKQLVENAKFEVEILALKQEKGQLDERVQTTFRGLVDLSAALGAVETLLKELKSAQSEYEALKVDYEAYNYFLQAMSKDGISKLIIADNLNLINSEIGKILSQGVGFTVELESTESGKEIEIYFKHEKSPRRNIELCSGMETTLAAIAIRAALVSVTTLPKSNIFVLDEVFSSLDVEYMSGLIDMLEYLKQMFDSVIIITHIDLFKDVVDHVIEIERDDKGYSVLS